MKYVIRLILSLVYQARNIATLVAVTIPAQASIPMLLGAIKRMIAQAREPERPVRHSAEPQNSRNDRAYSCGPVEVGWQGAH